MKTVIPSLVCNILFCCTLLFADEPLIPKNAIAFPDDNEKVDISIDLAEQIQFSDGKCYLTIKNPTNESIRPQISVIVLNSDGVIIWETPSEWLNDKIKALQIVTRTFDYIPSCPSSLKYSRWFKNFDLDGAWVIIQAK